MSLCIYNIHTNHRTHTYLCVRIRFGAVARRPKSIHAFTASTINCSLVLPPPYLCFVCSLYIQRCYEFYFHPFHVSVPLQITQHSFPFLIIFYETVPRIIFSLFPFFFRCCYNSMPILRFCLSYRIRITFSRSYFQFDSRCKYILLSSSSFFFLSRLVILTCILHWTYRPKWTLDVHK